MSNKFLAQQGTGSSNPTSTWNTVAIADIGNIGADTLLGNPTGAAAAPSVISLGAGLSFVGTALTAAGGGKTTWVLGAGTPVTVSVDKTAWAIIDQNRTPSKVYISAKTAPVGASLIVDILLSTNNGVSFTSLWAVTPANRPTLTTGNNFGTVIAFDTTSLPAGSLLRIDVIQVGSTTPGQDVTVQLQYQ